LPTRHSQRFSHRTGGKRVENSQAVARSAMPRSGLNSCAQ
jgi:hypothetical protein